MSAAARAAAGAISSRLQRGQAPTGHNGLAQALELAQAEQDLIAQNVLPPRAALVALAEFNRRKR